jgi:hypothetical protein
MPTWSFLKAAENLSSRGASLLPSNDVCPTPRLVLYKSDKVKGSEAHRFLRNCSEPFSHDLSYLNDVQPPGLVSAWRIVSNPLIFWDVVFSAGQEHALILVELIPRLDFYTRTCRIDFVTADARQ